MEEVRSDNLIRKNSNLNDIAFDELCLNRLHQSIESDIEDTSVIVRKRPIGNIQDFSHVNANTLTIQHDRISYDMMDYKTFHSFKFDRIVDVDQTNNEIFEENIHKYVVHSLKGGSSTLIAYGQTGTGKTHTMLEANTGIIYQSIEYALSQGRTGNISFFELYLGRISDCLNNNKSITLLEKDGVVYASEMNQIPYRTMEEANQIICDGLMKRKSAKLNENTNSSRSHAVIFIDFNQNIVVPTISNLKKLHSGSCMIFMDLAGSERGVDRIFDDKKLNSEGSEINKSLLALKECIRGIKYKSVYLPFRHSKLTLILKNSLIGNSKTLLIATIHTTQKNLNHTLNTLRYACRIKDNFAVFPKELITKTMPNTKIMQHIETKIPERSYIEFPSIHSISEVDMKEHVFENDLNEVDEKMMDVDSKLSVETTNNTSQVKDEIFYILPEIVEKIGIEDRAAKLKNILFRIKELRAFLKN